MRRVLPLVLALSLAHAPAAGGEIYRWTDAQGRVHFSQDLGQVPPEHRAAARDAAARPKPDRIQRIGGSAPASLAPSASRTARRGTSGGRSMSIPFERHNHLMVVEVRLNDRVTAPFLVDTGASIITLPKSLARKLAIRVTADTPRERFTTANGDVWEPIVRLDAVQIGGARVENLEASISSSMDIGLLGGNFFNNFVYRVDSAAGRIELQVNDSVRGGLSRDQWQERFRELRAAVRRIDRYLATNDLTSARHVDELREHRADFSARLASLEREANAARVPQSWRR